MGFRMTNKVLFAVVLAVAMILSGTAFAQGEDREEMLRLSAEGHEHYEAGRLNEAAQAYARAYEAYPQPILLKNQMVARYLLEECAEAITLGESFLAAEEPSDEDRIDVEAVFGECSLDLAEAALDAGDLSDAERWLDFGEEFLVDDQLRADGETLRGRINERRAAQDPVDDDDDTDAGIVEPPPVEGDGLTGRQIAGWSLTVVGAGTLVGAAVWNVQGLRGYAELERQDADGEPLDQELFDSVVRSRRVVPVVYAVGGLLTAGGLFLVFTGGADDSAGLSFEPQVSPEYAGGSLRLRF